MIQQSMFEKLQLTNERNLLIQGLPSSIEKQFIKLSYSKNVTPLLKVKKVEFALVFAINTNQLRAILNEVIPVLADGAKFWVASPKSTSKIICDLNRTSSWDTLTKNGFESIEQVTLDHCWVAMRFEKTGKAGANEEELSLSIDPDFDKNLVVPHPELEKIFNRHKKAREFFQNLSETNQQEFVKWIEEAKRQDTRTRRVEATVEKLLAGKKNPTEK
ncbi:MAG: hypothetical protein JWQ96_2832 [Segetibacter sp.]|nr:hypothetical protein [Segetibacter sp.]